MKNKQSIQCTTTTDRKFIRKTISFQSFILLLTALIFSASSFSQTISKKYFDDWVKSKDPSYDADKDNLYIIDGFAYDPQKLDSSINGWKTDIITNIQFLAPGEVWKVSPHQKPDHWILFITTRHSQSKKIRKEKSDKMTSVFANSTSAAKYPSVWVSDKKMEEMKELADYIMKIRYKGNFIPIIF